MIKLSQRDRRKKINRFSKVINNSKNANKTKSHNLYNKNNINITVGQPHNPLGNPLGNPIARPNYQPNMLFQPQMNVIPQEPQHHDVMRQQLQFEQANLHRLAAPIIKPPISSNDFVSSIDSEKKEIFLPDEIADKADLRKRKDIINPSIEDKSPSKPAISKPAISKPVGRPPNAPTRVRDPPKDITILTRDQLEQLKTSTKVAEKIEGLGVAVPASIKTNKVELIKYYLRIVKDL